jgi:hypothetical protein
MYCNVGAFSLQIAHLLGYTRVGLIGADGYYQKRADVVKSGFYDAGPLKGKPRHVFTKNDDKNHYRTDYFGEGQATSQANLKGVDASNTLDHWKQAQTALRGTETVVTSCTEGSRINKILPYTPLDTFLNGDTAKWQK